MLSSTHLPLPSYKPNSIGRWIFFSPVEDGIRIFSHSNLSHALYRHVILTLLWLFLLELSPPLSVDKNNDSSTALRIFLWAFPIFVIWAEHEAHKNDDRIIRSYELIYRKMLNLNYPNALSTWLVMDTCPNDWSLK